MFYNTKSRRKKPTSGRKIVRLHLTCTRFYRTESSESSWKGFFQRLNISDCHVAKYVKFLEDHAMDLDTLKDIIKLQNLKEAQDALRQVGIVKEGHVHKIVNAIIALDAAAPQ